MKAEIAVIGEICPIFPFYNLVWYDGLCDTIELVLKY